MVLGFQGYQTLKTYGSESALGVLVALSLVRELGPVVSALLFASRAGSAMTAEIGLMKATEQLSAMEMMAVDPIARVVAPRFWAGVLDAVAGGYSADGRLRRLSIGVVVIGVDEDRSGADASADFRGYRERRSSIVFGTVTWIRYSGLRRPAHSRGRLWCDHARWSPRRWRYWVDSSNRYVSGFNGSSPDLWVWPLSSRGSRADDLALRSATWAVLAKPIRYPRVHRGGLKPRAAVKIGVVGPPRSPDNDKFMAKVLMNIESRYKFPKDSSASVLTAGLLGEQYIGIEGGGEDAMLANGDALKLAQSAVVLEKLISQFMFNKAAEGGSAK